MRSLKLGGKLIIGAILLALIFFGLNHFGLIDKYMPTVTNTITSLKAKVLEPKVEKVFDENDSQEVKYEKQGEILKEKNAVNMTVIEWPGWKPIIDANGGLRTAKGSIYDQLGLKLNINIINDPVINANALISGDTDCVGYTVNRYATMISKFKKAGIKTCMPILVDASTGGDGIIAKEDIKSINDLVGKKIGVPRLSEGYAMLEWLLNESDLNEGQKAKVREGYVFFDDTDAASKAFFSGELDASVTFQPYLTQATSTTNSHILFSTKDAQKLIMDGLVFKKDFVDANPEIIKAIAKGMIMAQETYAGDNKYLKTLAMFELMSDEEINSMINDVTFLSAKDNNDFLKENGEGYTLFNNMCDTWEIIGEEHGDKSDKAMDNTIMKDVFAELADNNAVKSNIDASKKSTDTNALLSKKLTINFDVDSATISSDSYDALNEFAKTANIIDNTFLQVEGNTDSSGDPEHNKKLSEERARSIAKYLQTQGIDSSRFIIIGNGQDNPIADNSTDEGKSANRRTEIKFKSQE